MQNCHDYGVDWQGPVAADAEDNIVEVPETPCTLSDAQLLLLRAITLENTDGDVYSIGLFQRILHEVERMMQLSFQYFD